MDTILQAAAIVAGLCLLPVFLFVGVYSFNALWRVVKHWDTTRPPPQSIKGTLFGQSVEVVEQVEQVSEGLANTVAELDRRIKRLEADRLRGILKELAEKRRLKHGKKK
jgi:hypothetical protein